MALVNSSPVELNINLPNLAKIEKLLNDSSYSELIEFSSNFNTRLCVERRLRLPFLDPQTGVAQKHSNLFMKKSQRIPGLRDGQIYSYPSARWRKAKRQYLTNANAYPFNYRPFGRFRENEFEHHPAPVGEHFAPPEESSFRPGMTEDSHSKDSHKEDGSKSGWYYDEMDIHDMDNFDDPEEDSDDDFMEPRSGRKKRSSTRTPGSSSRRSGKEKEDTRRGRNNNRGRGKKINPPPMDNSSNSSDKFSEYSRRRALNPPQVTTTHNPNPMSFDEAIPEHKIPTTERGKTHFDDDPHRMSLMSAATSSAVGMSAALLGSPSKMTALEKSEKPRANPSTYCDFCLGDARENKKTGTSEVRNHLKSSS